jgi:hypothetical protein
MNFGIYDRIQLGRFAYGTIFLATFLDEEIVFSGNGAVVHELLELWSFV